MVSLLLNRTIYSSVALHTGDVQKAGGFAVQIFTQTQSWFLLLAKHIAK